MTLPTTTLTTVINNLIGTMWWIFVGAGVIMFLWAGILFSIASGNESELTKARHAVIWGVVGIALGILAFSLPSIFMKILGGTL